MPSEIGATSAADDRSLLSDRQKLQREKRILKYVKFYFEASLCLENRVI